VQTFWNTSLDFLQAEETITRFVKNIHLSKGYADELTKTVIVEWDKRNVETVRDDVSIESKIAELNSQIIMTLGKIKYLTTYMTKKSCPQG
jgi:hypothetical protein